MTREPKDPAALWCWLNGWRMPDGRPAESAEERAEIGRRFAAMTSAEKKAGMRLWAARWEQRLDCVTGEARP